MQGHSWRRPLLIRACSWMQVRSLRRPSPPFPHKTKIEKAYLSARSIDGWMVHPCLEGARGSDEAVWASFACNFK